MSSRQLNNVSDLFFAIGDAIHGAGLGVSVSNYDEFGGEVGDAEVLIEIERTGPGVKLADGRHVHNVSVTLHAVVARWRKFAPLEAMNLATALERLVDSNRWGLPGRQCDLPENMHCSPSIFQQGKGGYEAWGCSFTQRLGIGRVRTPEDPVIGGMPLIAWRMPDDDNPPDLSDPDQYKPLEV
ncbi:hypothetical protein [Pseudomonas frederiksbergensis]|uniref:Uncharacterized protein n=1 Tax=Pseudomonas frederiksbergensis TaxID=104087 RepID=A0A423HS86_9PSED|nr:hypothetical protein [Pseudomonas frederiksbergensis]RON16045.1 hypothetical protein BK662_11490 [Pseudomonas frederiksbergensis]